jgi:hypothetical protein
LQTETPSLCTGASGAARPIITYDDLTPFANVVDIRGVWKALNLPQLPETFCHVGLLGWHCHNTTGGLQPWNPASLIPKEQTPPMPANASCIICPQGWHGQTKNLIEVLIDVPIVQKTGKLPAGSFYDMKQLQAVAQQAAAAAATVKDSEAEQQAAAAADSADSADSAKP